MDPIQTLAHLGGVAETARLRAAGLSPRALRVAVESGAIVRVRRGCYALPQADPIRVAEVAWRGVATCVTRARQLGLPLLREPPGIHLAVARGRSFGKEHLTPPAHLRFHYVDDPVRAGSVIGCLDSMAACVDPVTQLAAVDGALYARRLPLRALRELTVTGRERAAFLRRFARNNTPSPGESAMRVLLTRARLHFEEHVWLIDVGEVDFVVDEWLIIEVDGRTVHDHGPQVDKDRRRARMAIRDGRPTLRFSFNDVVNRPERTIDEIRAALTSRQLRRARRRQPSPTAD